MKYSLGLVQELCLIVSAQRAFLVGFQDMKTAFVILILMGMQHMQSTRHYIDFEDALRDRWSFLGLNDLPPCSMLLESYEQEKLQGSENSSELNTCRFRPNLNTCFGPYMSTHDTLTECLTDTWYCIVPDFEVCNGKSLCLTDECKCRDNRAELFYCGDGQGCLSLNLVCDGNYDCFDKSDELLCDEVVNLTCSNSEPKHLPFLTNMTFSISKFLPCSLAWNGSNIYSSLYPFSDCDLSFCATIDFENSKVAGFEKMEGCMNKLDIAALEIDSGSDTEKWLNLNLSSVCLDVCKDLASEEVCKNIVSGKYISTPGRLYEFRCHNHLENTINETPHNEQFLDMRVVCDGTFDCADKSDELFCLDRFYCSKGEMKTSWISPEARCNSYKDCRNGRDECDDCTDGSLSSDQFIVRNQVIFAWLIASCLGNLILNVYLFWENIKLEFASQENYVKVDRVLKLQICVYDGFLGVYLFAVIIANIRYWGRYCLSDDEWRSGWVCQCLGMLFNFSSHGSLLAVLLMSLTRAYKCTFSYSQGIHLRSVVILSIIIAVFNLAHSIIPAIPVEFIQNIFRIKLTMSQLNPFIMKDFDNLTHIDRIYFQYFGKKEADVGLYEKLEELKKITNKPDVFSYRELSFYSWSPVCVQDLYGYRESLQNYKGCYITFILAVLATLSASYVKILKVFLQSKRTVNAQGNEDHDSENTLRLKVTFIIGTKLVSWLTIIGAMTYYHFSQKNVPNGWFETTAICIVPVNSILNPIFNSEILQSTKKFFKDKFSPQSVTGLEETMLPALQAADVLVNTGRRVSKSEVEEVGNHHSDSVEKFELAMESKVDQMPQLETKKEHGVALEKREDSNSLELNKELDETLEQKEYLMPVETGGNQEVALEKCEESTPLEFYEEDHGVSKCTKDPVPVETEENLEVASENRKDSMPLEMKEELDDASECPKDLIPVKKDENSEVALRKSVQRI